MYIFVEIWNVKPAWLALEQSQRAEYMQNVGSAIQSLSEQGIELISWSKRDSDTPYASKYQYFAVWKMPNQDAVTTFENAVEGAGWYNYFEQENLRGQFEATPGPVNTELISLT